ncbi:hypothetical protein EDD17DRAFT_1766973 [Pisolithus thermaeus]|nr:hypothetical protein EDD17DRAFT_1766973 [Pisolithus thermaeus]
MASVSAGDHWSRPKLDSYKDTCHHPHHPMTDPGLTHQEAMEELGLALDKALYDLKAISDHTTFPADFIDKVTSIYEKVSGSNHKQPQPTPNSNKDIVSILMKLTQEVEDLKWSHTNQLTSHPPKDSFATGPIIKTQPKLPTQTCSNPILETRRLNNPMTCHHLACLIIQPVSLLHPPMSASLTKASVVAVKWNDKAEDLLPHSKEIAKALLDCQALDGWTAKPDKKWHRVLVHGVDTGKSEVDDIQDLNDFQGWTMSELEDKFLTQTPS